LKNDEILAVGAGDVTVEYVVDFGENRSRHDASQKRLKDISRHQITETPSLAARDFLGIELNQGDDGPGHNEADRNMKGNFARDEPMPFCEDIAPPKTNRGASCTDEE